MSNDLNFSLPLSLGNDLEFALSQGKSGGMFNAILFNSGLFNQIPISGESESAFLRLRSESGETAENFILSEAPLIIQYLDGDAYSGQYNIIDGLQHSDILPMDAYAGALASISYIQHSTVFSLDAYTGETQKVLTFTTDPYYYHSNANNNFAFFCEYNAPVGEVNLIFPDTPCAAFAYFDAYSGERSYVVELLTADWIVLNFSGQNVDISLATYALIPIAHSYAGENSFVALLVSALLAPISYSGETNLLSTITIPPRAELAALGVTGENITFDVAATYSLGMDSYSGEVGSSSFTPTDYGAYILLEGPAAYWKFNEQSGTSATDSTGNNSAATISGANLGYTSPVASHYAFYFDGTNDTVIGNPTSVVSSNLTQELWVKPDSGATITLYTPSSSGTQGVTGQRYAIWPRQSGTGSGGGISVGSNGIQVVAHGNYYLPILLSYQQPISTTQYTHILVSWNDRTPTLYVNGVAVATGYQARAQFNSQGLPSDGTYGYYKGYMQDVAIYTSALTADQAREHYLAGIGLHYIPRFEPVPSYSGENLYSEVAFDKTPFGYILNFTGEYTQAFLENNVRFYPNMVSGEVSAIYENKLTVIPNSTFTYFHGPNSHSETSTCITLQSAVSSVGGINAAFYLPTTLNLQSISELNIRFKRTRPSSWYDDDLTDAQLMVYIFPNWLTSEIQWLSSSWHYDRPKERTSEGNVNPQTFIINYRFDVSTAIVVRWFENSSTLRWGTLTVVSNFTTNEINGTDSTTTQIVTSGSGTTVTVYGGDGKTVRQQGTFSSMPNIWTNVRSTTNDIILFHYHNYQSSRPEVLCDIAIFEYEGIVLVPFISLGISQAYSGENALIDNLRTSSLLDPPAYSGEVSDVVFSTNPSVDLGIVSNLTGETNFAILTISAAISISNYAGEIHSLTVSFYPSSGVGILPSYTGERLEIALITYSIFRDVDSREGQNLSLDLITRPPAELDSAGYSGERGLFDLSVELAIEVTGRSGENALFLFDTHPAIELGIVNQYSGERAENILLVTSSVLPVTAYTGENNYLTFTTFEGVSLDLPAYSGSRYDTAVATASLLAGLAYTGQYSDSTLSTSIGSTIVPTFYSGTFSESTLRTVDRLVPSAYSDQYTVVTLSDSPAIPIQPVAYSGQIAAASILPGITFPSIAYDGARGTFDLDYIVNTGMPTLAYEGGRGDLSLATEDALSILGRSGEYGYLDLGAAYAIEIIGYSGSRASASITENLADQLISQGYSGQYTYPITLSTRTNLPNVASSGEVLYSVLTDNPAAPLLLQAYAGARGYGSMQTAAQIPINLMPTGQWANVIGMTNEPHWRWYAGQNSFASLSTSDVLPLSSLSGERLFCDLETHPPIPMYPHAYAGQNSFWTFDAPRAVNFRVLYRTSIMTQVDIKSATYFDLTTDACCGVRPDSNNLNFILERGMLPEEVAFGVRTFMTVDLCCAYRMKAEIRTGQWCGFIDNVDYFEIHFETPLQSIGLEWDADLRHRLCKGYFIPTGEWIVTELTDVLPEDCYTDRIYTGQTLYCELSDDQVLRIDTITGGSRLDVAILTREPWILTAFSGERMYWDRFEVGTMYTGERMFLTFYEPPIHIYSGGYGEFTLETENYVRFKEVGCLDNEFQYQNEDGDLIPELFNPVPVEGEPYQHDLKAECF